MEKPPLLATLVPSPKVSRHRARDHIARMITTGQCGPGTKLDQQRLAEQLGVSRAAVREAIFELSGMGLIETADHRGATVREFNVARLIESFELREMLEGLSARRCCDHITVLQLRELGEMVSQIHSLRQKDKHERSGQLDREFHLRLMRIAGSHLLERLTTTYAMLGKIVTSQFSDANETLAEHRAILTRIQSGDADAAEKAARDHIRRAKNLVRKHHCDDSMSLKWIV